MAAFGPWRPDLPQYNHDGLVEAANVYHSVAGYKPVRTLSSATTALSYAWLGGGAFTASGGSSLLLAGTTDGIYSGTATSWTKKYPAGAGSYSLPFFFIPFGDAVICLSGSTAPVSFDLTAGTAALLGGSPPSASFGAVIGDHLFLSGNSAANSTIYSSAIDTPDDWSTTSNGAGSQVLPDDGPVTGMCGGEYGLVFHETAIRMVETTDAPIFWTQRKVIDGTGALCHGGIVRAGRQVCFYSRDGFKMWNEGEIVPIGKDAVDLTFADLYTEADVKATLRSSYDQKRRLVIWSMPGRLWLFNVDTQSWTHIDVPGLVGITSGKTTSVTLEDLGTAYGTLEAIPKSLDDPSFQGGQPMMLVAKTDKTLYSLGGATNMAATFQLAKQEIEKGRHCTVRLARPETDCIAGMTVTLDMFPRLGDSATTRSTASIRDNGDMPILASGRYVQSKLTIAEGSTWTVASGLDLVATPTGTR